MVIRKTPSQIEDMARSGRIVAEVLGALEELAVVGAVPKDLDRAAEQAIRERGGVPSFLGYRGFPASICTSRNEVVVHGIPDLTALVAGDLLSVDVAVNLDGWHTDAARTFAIGEVSQESERLSSAVRGALAAGIALCRPGARLGDLGYAVEQVIEDAGFSVVREFVGHGIGRSMHEDPQVPNHGPAGLGPVLEEGWVLAIEPIATAGGWKTHLLDDRWGAVTADGSRSAHFEDTVAVTAAGPRVLTAPPGTWAGR